ncbi:hypothetical protein LCGC14_1341490 [marine sediment metagenome]|uniref:PARP-type domain-containing protein n=1 Tax=marine sediment metagenome TaxID=412755 RepID=A0A0F9KDH0_9ZZZZ
MTQLVRKNLCFLCRKAIKKHEGERKIRATIAGIEIKKVIHLRCLVDIKPPWRVVTNW